MHSSLTSSSKGDSLCNITVLYNVAHWHMQHLCFRPFQDWVSAHTYTAWFVAIKTNEGAHELLQHKKHFMHQLTVSPTLYKNCQSQKRESNAHCLDISECGFWCVNVKISGWIRLNINTLQNLLTSVVLLQIVVEIQDAILWSYHPVMVNSTDTFGFMSIVRTF